MDQSPSPNEVLIRNFFHKVEVANKVKKALREYFREKKQEWKVINVIYRRDTSEELPANESDLTFHFSHEMAKEMSSVWEYLRRFLQTEGQALGIKKSGIVNMVFGPEYHRTY